MARARCRQPRAWWRLFGDSTLNSLVDRGLAENQELAGAAARVSEARQFSKMARSRYFPAMDMGVSADRTKFRYRGPGGGSSLINNFAVPVDLRYEIDTWGKVRRQVEAATARESATNELLAALRLTVAAEIAQTYWALRAVDADRAVLARTLEIRSKISPVYQEADDATPERERLSALSRLVEELHEFWLSLTDRRIELTDHSKTAEWVDERGELRSRIDLLGAVKRLRENRTFLGVLTEAWDIA
jgi:hypothetical protein